MIRFHLPLLALLAICLPAVAVAGTLQLSPTSLDLSATQRSAIVQLQNRGGDKVNIQARIFKWSQEGGKDVLAPAADIVVSPPATQLAPGVAYTLRVLHKSPQVSEVEQSYRLIIDELPDVNVKRPSTAVSMVVRQSLPIFFSKSSSTPDLQWHIRREKGGYVLAATNRGTRHAKITNLKVGSTVVQQGLSGYVLPGSSRHWPLGKKVNQLKAGAKIAITAEGSDYGVNTIVQVEG